MRDFGTSAIGARSLCPYSLRVYNDPGPTMNRILPLTAVLALYATTALAAPGHDMSEVGGSGDGAHSDTTGGDATGSGGTPDDSAAPSSGKQPSVSENADSGSARGVANDDLLPEGAAPFADQELGKTFTVTADSLPEPYTGPAARNPALTIDRGDNAPEAPDGYEVTLFADSLINPRQMYVLPNGDVLLAQQAEGVVTFLRDTNGDGQSDLRSLFAQGFEGPYGLARVPEGKEHAGDILVADYRGVWRVPFTLGEVRASGAAIFAPKPITDVAEGERHAQLPMDHFPVTEQGVFGGSEGHNTRSLVVSPDGETMYVGVGSASNIGTDAPPRATIQAFDIDGGNQRTHADGTRNPVGLAFRPGTDELWAIVMERDGMGDELVPDFLARIEEGDFYGWPYSYIGDNLRPRFADLAPEGRIESAKVPEVLFEGHSAAIEFAFAPPEFGADYEGDVFVALKGSWNRADPTGYKVVRVPFEDGEPTGSYENFLNGFWVEGDDRAVVWGRPADIAFMPDGAMLVADDTGGTIWHVAPSGAGTDDTQTGSVKLPTGNDIPEPNSDGEGGDAAGQ